jgi:hypothetical protein
MTDLTGYPELTPYEGGWCGNDIFPEALSAEHRQRARALTRQLGDRLASEGYRGFFEVDYLADLDTGELYLGELNPRVSGVSSMTNATAGAYADMPLFLFHLLEYMGIDYEIDVEDINRRWAQDASVDVWSQLVLKQTDDRVELITDAPRTGVWRIDEGGQIAFGRWGNDWHSIHDESEAFYLRVLGPGDYRYRGADLGVLVTRSRMQTDEGHLTDRAHQWIAAIEEQFVGTPLAADEPPPRTDALAFKTA